RRPRDAARDRAARRVALPAAGAGNLLVHPERGDGHGTADPVARPGRVAGALARIPPARLAPAWDGARRDQRRVACARAPDARGCAPHRAGRDAMTPETWTELYLQPLRDAPAPRGQALPALPVHLWFR